MGTAIGIILIVAGIVGLFIGVSGMLRSGTDTRTGGSVNPPSQGGGSGNPDIRA